MKAHPPAASRVTLAAWLLAGLALVFVLAMHLVPALLSALLVYVLVHWLAPAASSRVDTQRAKVAAVALIAVVIASLIAGVVAAAVLFLNGHGGHLPALLARMAEILETARDTLPGWLAAHVPSGPEGPDGVKDSVVVALRDHLQGVRTMGAEVGRTLVHILVGLVIGAMVALHQALPAHAHGPLALALIERAERFSDAFGKVVFAQLRIAAINAAFTAIYLYAVLPLFGVGLPFRKTLVAVTLITGLVPVVGNLVSNAAVVVVSLAHSPGAALASLSFLVLVHKFEYFLNAKIVGTRIHARPWEILIAMLALESVFGIPGVIAAPIYYAYLKGELVDRGLV
ncbi:MAG: AI-2E family transporter [Casimicrobiaceae bacterium]